MRVSRSLPVSLAAALSLLSGTGLMPFMSAPAHAQAARTFTWTGGGGSAWETNSSWDSSLYADSPTTAASFLSGVANALALLGSDHSVYGISFDYNAVQTATRFTISGSGSDNALNVYGGGITNATALTQTIDARIALRASQSFTSFTTVSGGTLSFTAGPYNRIDLAGRSLSIDGAGNTNIASNIIDSTGTGTGTGSGGSLNKGGAGTLTLTGANTYTGATQIVNGILNVGSASAGSSLGAGAVVNTGAGTLNFNSTSMAGSASITNFSILRFNNTSSAGSADIANVSTLEFNDASSAGSASLGNGGSIDFNNTSTAGAATITNGSGGYLYFSDASSAGSAAITNRGRITFSGSSMADNATIFNGSGASMNISQHTGALSIGRLSGAGWISLGSTALTIGGLNASDTISAAIDGNGGNLTKIGTGTLTLTGANTYTGGTTISGGFLNVGSSASTLPVAAPSISSSLGSAAGGIVNNGGLTLYAGSTLFSPATTGAGIVTNSGVISFFDSASTGAAAITTTVTPAGQPPRILHFYGTSTADNAVIVNGSGSFVNLATHSGGIRIGSLSGAGTVFLPRAALTVGGLNTSTTISGEIRDGSSQSGSLIKEGTGTLTLSGANTYTGGTTISGGTLSIGADTNLGTGGLILNGGLLQWTGDSETFGRPVSLGSATGSGFDITSAGTNLTVGSPLTGSGGLVKAGVGSLTLTGANTYTGTTTVNYGGSLNVGDNAAKLSSSLGSGTGGVTNNGGLYFHYQSSAGSAQITNNQGMVFYDRTTAGTATITNNSYLYFLDTSDGSMAQIVNNASGGNGHLDLSGYTGPGGPRLGSVSGDGIIQLGSKTVTLGSLNAGSTISGAIQDGGYNGGTGGKIVKTGSGTLTLTGANTYTGGTTVSAGTLVARGSALGTGAVTVASGATLAVGEAANTSLIPQATGTLTLSSLSVTLGSPTPILTFNLGNSGVSDKLVMTAAIKPLSFSSAANDDFVIGFSSATGSSLGAGTYTLFSFAAAQAQGILPSLSSYKARPTGNLGSLVTDSSAFGYVTDGNGMVTGLAFTIQGASMETPEPGTLALIVFALPLSVILRMRRRRRESPAIVPEVPEKN